MSSHLPTVPTPTHIERKTNVRFTPEQFAELERDQRNQGKSIPDLLREAYFNGKPTAILFCLDDLKTFLSELNRQGNNLNQIARKVNAGFREGLEQDIAQVRLLYMRLIALITQKIAHA